MAQQSFVFYDSMLDNIDCMTPEECKTLLIAIRCIRKDEPLPDADDRYMKKIIQDAVNMIEQNEEKYKLKCEKMAANSRKRKFFADKEKPSEEKESTPIVQVEEVKADTPPKEKNSRMTKPSIDDVLIYFAEKSHPSTEAHKFFDYYESNGWRVGRNPMKDWHAAVRNWMSNVKSNQSHGHINTKYERQVAAQQQLGADLAQRSAEEFAAESLASNSAESGWLPPPL